MRRYFSLIVFIAIAQPTTSWSQTTKPATIAEVANYSGPDREQMLAAGAKKEGKLVWYTALAGGSYKDLAQAFQAKYGVQVESYRGTSKDLISKFLAEAQAKRFIMDVAESSPPLLMLMQALKFLQPFSNQFVTKLISDAREDAGKGAVFYATVRESYMGFAYNKNKLPASAVPKNYDDLLKPGLKGRMSFVTTDTGSRTVGGMLRVKGDEYLRKLRGQEITMHSVSGQALNDMIISGEVEASPTIFRNHALVAAERKAPVAWVPMDIVPASAGSAGLSTQAPHPHAAVLFVDFLFSPDGQKILEAYDYGSPAKEYGFKRWYPEKGVTIQQLEKDSDRWERALRRLVDRNI
ncbi:MAG TPA: extracellular solute-binding protein [Candidatus Limnocylindrales bacterium]|nr:extracellular solute-binding protein [Candidatus Limnocylindrales bacterium]